MTNLWKNTKMEIVRIHKTIWKDRENGDSMMKNHKENLMNLDIMGRAINHNQHKKRELTIRTKRHHSI